MDYKMILRTYRRQSMEFKLTKESMELLVESIVDAVESTRDRDLQFEMVKTILEDNGVAEIKK